ncbi:MAG: MATE family efflux transporter [Hyphomicrobiaceae bacterium]
MTAWTLELKTLFNLSWPLALANVAQIAMNTTDVVMMGRLGPETVAAGSLGTNLFFIALIIGTGLFNAISPMMAHTLGQDRTADTDVATIVRQGLLAACVLALPCLLILWQAEAILRTLGQSPDLSREAGTYVRAVCWALLPFWGYLVLRSFISTLERPFWSLILAIAGIGINAVGNWCLMLGQCGLAPMGIAGSGIATVLASTAMFAGLAAAIGLDPAYRRYRLFSGAWTPDPTRLRELLRLGLPMAATLLFEMSVFSAAVFLMGLLGTAELAAHAIAIQIAALTFMVPLGIGQAATVRVGLAVGANDHQAMSRAGWTAFAMAIAFMASMAVVMLLIPRTLVSAFIDVAAPENQSVVGFATTFLFLAALFQVADGAQAVGGGMLRGLHDTRVPMLYALAGYWAIGLPLGAVLAFPVGLGGKGIWIGLATGLTVVAILMISRWAKRLDLGLIRRETSTDSR